jgi:signal transduction histidine kinase
VRSLTHRNRFAEAIALGVESLRELGLDLPAEDRLTAELVRLSDGLYRWLDHDDNRRLADPAQVLAHDDDDLDRPDITDPTLLAVAGLIDATLPPAYFGQDFSAFGWLSLEALRILIELGPARALIGPAAHAAFYAVVLRGDYAAAYRARRRILALSEARGYEPATSQARFLFALLSCWVEPIENSLRDARQAREGLTAGGDLANAGYTYITIVTELLDTAPSLDAFVVEVEAGLAFVRRTGMEQTGQTVDAYRWLLGALRGQGTSADGEVAADSYLGNPQGLFQAHFSRALAAAIFDDHAGLVRHTEAAMSLATTALGTYTTALARLLRGLALAGQARASQGDDRGLLAELDEVAQWLADRAADAPANFRHLVRLIEAERAWAAGDFRAAVLAFDAARREVAQRPRPWHRALIAERAAAFYLAHGVEQAGYDLLAEARQEYLAWGATAKVDQLDWAHPTLRPDIGPSAEDGDVDRDDLPQRRSIVTTGTIDLLGILSASQALSSETSIERLHPRVVGVLSAMTGATDVHLLQWSDERQDWLLAVRGGDAGTGPTGDPDRGHAAPMSVLRYVQRMREPLVVEDAIRDDRFARDPYFTDVTCCALLAVPILSRGRLSAALLLENRLIRRAFTTERLDAVRLIAGQLAVSLDNVQLYAEFRRIADEQTALRRVATLVAHGLAPDVVFAAVAAEVGALFGADGAAIVRFEPDGEMTVLGGYGFTRARPGWRGRPNPVGVLGPVRATGRAARRDVEPGLPVPPSVEGRSAVACPIVVEGKVWGAVGVGAWRDRLPQDTEPRLAEFTELVATAIANTESRAELTTSRARIVAAADHTRRHIEQNLHDGAQQRLVSLAVRLRAAQVGVPPGLAELTAQLDHAVGEATGALEELRETARGIHPAILVDGGLRAALRALARRSSIPVDLRVQVDKRLNEQVELAVYYVVAEALTNAAKHSHATTVTVTVTVTVDTDPGDTVLRVEVSDDGDGGADFTRGTGLVGLKDRVEALGGRIVLHSPRGAGTNLRVQLTLPTTNEHVTP